MIGSIIFAVATIRAGVFSRRAAIALAVSSAVVLVVAIGGMGVNTQGPFMELLFAVVLGSFAASWIALGIIGPSPRPDPRGRSGLSKARFLGPRRARSSSP